MLKRLLEAIGSMLVVVLIWCLCRTVRRVLVNWHVMEVLERRGQTALLGVWHNQCLYFMDFLGKIGLTVMISKSRDGERVTRISRPFGIRTVRGSSSNAALSAIRDSVRVLRERHLAITPDGPRGPRYVAQPGLVGVARLSGVPVVPMAWSASRYWEFGSWDRLRLPKPFAKVYIFVGEPIMVPRDEDPETARVRIQSAMRRQLRDADRFAGGDLTDREPLLAETEPAAGSTAPFPPTGQSADPAAG